MENGGWLMLTRQEKVAERKLKSKFDDKFITKLNRRLARFKKESSWSVDYWWDKKKKELMVQTTDVLLWRVFFKNRKVEIYAEGPTYLAFLVLPFKDKVAKAILDEIDLLDK
jgi:hypothetical protein